MTTDLKSISFDIIGPAGEARSIIFETLDNLNSKKITVDEALSSIEEADKLINEAAKNHMAIITKEAEGEELRFSTIFMHAEDIFLTTQTMSELVKRLIPIYRKLSNE